MEIDQEGFTTIAGLRWRVWPTIPVPTEAEALALARIDGPQAVVSWHRDYHEAIHREETDPLVHGWDLPCAGTLRELLAGTYVPGRIGTANPLHVFDAMPTKANDVLVMGGNGSGKTRIAARLAMEKLTRSAKSEVRCCSQNEQTSIRYIQVPLYQHLPPALRSVKKYGQHVKISYTESTGFSDGIFILPNRSAALMLTYKAWSQDPKSVEGGEADMIWGDEEMPADLADTLRFRAHKKAGGQFILTFTPVSGYSSVVAQYLEAAEIVETIPARRIIWDARAKNMEWGEWILPADKELVKGCPPGHVPYVLRCHTDRRWVVLFPTPMNPYTNVEGIVTGAAGKTEDFALERIWGWPTKRAAKAFPRFGANHIVAPHRIPVEGTNYLFADPHGRRNWFMVWLRVDAGGTIYAYREWPSMDIGEWALPCDKPDGKEGPAQRHQMGMSFRDYKVTIYGAEGWKTFDGGKVEAVKDGEVVFARYMDPRPANTSVPSDEQAMTYMEHMMTDTTDPNGNVLIPGLDFMAAPACAIEEGTGLLADWITGDWDPKAPVTPMNCPKFYVSKNCPNLIYALSTWTGLDGEKGATKDPIDCLRGAAKLGLSYFANSGLESFGGGSY